MLKAVSISMSSKSGVSRLSAMVSPDEGPLSATSLIIVRSMKAKLSWCLSISFRFMLNSMISFFSMFLIQTR